MKASNNKLIRVHRYTFSIILKHCNIIQFEAKRVFKLKSTGQILYIQILDGSINCTEDFQINFIYYLVFLLLLKSTLCLYIFQQN